VCTGVSPIILVADHSCRIWSSALEARPESGVSVATNMFNIQMNQAAMFSHLEFHQVIVAEPA
jgi:hypothetical protein